MSNQSISKHIIVKFDTHPWDLSQEQFNLYTPNGDGVIEGYKFFINSNIKECDFWIVRGSIRKNWDLVKCSSRNVILLLDEAYDAAEYPLIYLKQFHEIIGPKTILSPKYSKHHEMFPWLFKQKSYSFLYQNMNNIKTKEICIIASDATWLQGHKDRFAFVNKLIGHFKDRIDVYGRGFNQFDCKYEILKNYKYSVCIENSSLPDYFTEKINECYLAEVFPIYFGCTNIEDYYEQDAFVLIDIHNLDESIEKIEFVLKSNLWQEKRELIRQMKLRYLTKYHLPFGILALLKNRNRRGHKSWNLTFSLKFYTKKRLSIELLRTGFLQVLSKYFVNGISKVIKEK